MSQSAEIKYVSENEIWIGSNKVMVEGNTIHVIAQGEQTTEMAHAHLKLNQKLFSSMEGKVNFLIDLNKAGKNSPEARQIWVQHGKLEKTSKIALLGIHPVARVLASFVMGINKPNNVCFFSSEEEAVKWLKQS